MNGKTKKYSGFAMLGVGFLMLATHAAGYIYDLDIKNPTLTVLGLVFVVTGGNVIRRARTGG